MPAKKLFASAPILLAWLVLVGTAFLGRADAPPRMPADSVAFDADSKTVTAKAGDDSAALFFSVTNISDANVVIDHVQTSCHCTVGKLPSQPWVLKPHEDGKIDVTVDLRGKSGTVFKTVTVYFTNGPAKPLNVQVVIPDNPEMVRSRNQQMATADRQAVFKNDCATCHLVPTRGKSGRELFAAACGICHEAEHRATMVPNLHALNHSTDRIYWKQWIETGKDGTLMPGFGAIKGGPLTEEQIDSLADYLNQTIPHDPPAPPHAALPPAVLRPPVRANLPPPPLPPMPAVPARGEIK